ncbi:MAG: orotidine-5'-phosphate decarboxylase [Spirochaetaceae bacterium]|nr:MAG: orotidine-5'-phosphate decarboxylase [Spirochaetaceae bacterium]
MQQEQLILALDDIGAVRFGSFRLKSGVQSPFYLDLRTAVTRPQLCRAMAELLVARTTAVTYDAVVGIPYTAVPIATHMSAITGKPLLQLRKERKHYGTGGLVVGDYTAGMRCLVVDDLVTTGQSKLETIEALKAEGLRAEHIAVVIDRSSEATAQLATHGLQLHALTSVATLVQTLLRAGRISNADAEAVDNFIHSSEQSDRSDNTAVRKPTAPSGPLLQRIRDTMQRKKSNLVLSLDVTDQQRFFAILEACAPSLCMVKTHADIMQGDLNAFSRRLRRTAEQADLLILEDRKFADIGSTVQKQFQAGPARIAEWADLVTVHMIAGEAILDGLLPDSAGAAGADCGALLLARMSSRGNLISQEYTRRVFEIGGRRRHQVPGYIGHAEDHAALRALKRQVPPGQLLLVPGVNLSAQGDDLGQQYLDVNSAVSGGADAIIVGRGIYQEQDPAAAAQSYRSAAWSALQHRMEEET